jgi:hypothetical protein
MTVRSIPCEWIGHLLQIVGRIISLTDVGLSSLSWRRIVCEGLVMPADYPGIEIDEKAAVEQYPRETGTE